MKSGGSGHTVSPASRRGMPAFGWIATGSAVRLRNSDAISTIASEPWPQFEPTAEAPASSSARHASSTPVPMIVKNPRGVRSKVIVATTGVPGIASRASRTAIDASETSVIVSTTTASTPASARARIVTEKLSRTSSGETSPQGSRRRPEGPHEP